jgi:Bacterial archaeo-eukaryotic release factor family 2
MSTVDTALDLAAVRSIVRPLEPVASVYLAPATPHPTVDPAAELDLRRRAIEAGLGGQGADRATIDVIGGLVAGLPAYPTELAIFAADGRILLAQPVPGGAPVDRIRFGMPADVLPLLAWLRRHPPYVEVVTDRTGADITVVPGGGGPGSTCTVIGPDDEIERNAPGGWSQPRYQRRAEDSWQHNATVVAEAVSRALTGSRASLLLVAGDVRAVQLLRDHLPHPIHGPVSLRHLPGGRGHDGSQAARQAAIAAAVDAYVAEGDAAALQRFADRGPGRSVQGAPATLAALAAGRVETLLVSDEPTDRVAWFGPDLWCAATPDDAPAAGAGRLLSGRLVDVAVRAALCTDAEVRVIDGPVPGGIAGLCRFAAA